MTSGKMVDLDALADHCNSTLLRCFVGSEFPDSVLAIVAELRAAREVVEVTRSHAASGCIEQGDEIAVSEAIDSYDAAINHGAKP